ncbi:hypothetical protein AB0C29_41730, partial [Actinoplanes sp. NPDC048791]|uniref:hypothetical protein n=1 Tax=Actinoplanes sp. NPDC048791 TaxID=3154623 RepID=UPI0033C12D54
RLAGPPSVCAGPAGDERPAGPDEKVPAGSEPPARDGQAAGSGETARADEPQTVPARHDD